MKKSAKGKKIKKAPKKIKSLKKPHKAKIRKPKIKKRKIWEKNVALMKKRIELSFNKLKNDIKNKAPLDKIEKDNNELLMLLGECNYVVREFHEHSEEK